MSVKCQNCGTVQPGGKFCPSCGGQMIPLTQNPPPPPQPQMPQAHMPQMPQAQMPPRPPQQPFYPQQQPPAAGGGKGWILWAGIGGVVVVGAILAFILLGDKPAPTPPKTNPPAASNTTNPTPPASPAGKTTTGPQVKVLSQGTLGARPDSMVSYGNYLGFANDTIVSIYKFNASGKPELITGFELNESQGQLKGLAVGPLNNDGVVQMLALFENKLYVLPATPDGELRDVANNADEGVSNILMGDYDGDGKTETIILGKEANGTHSFQVWRYPGDSWIYKKEGRQDPWPELFQTELKAGKKSLMMGYEFVDNTFNLLLYQWDGASGPVLFGRYPAENSADAPPEWIASGNTGLGATLAVVRGGAKSTVELLTVNQDGKAAKSQGRFEPAGGARQTVLPGKFTGQNSQLITVDESGNYTVYDLGK